MTVYQCVMKNIQENHRSNSMHEKISDSSFNMSNSVYTSPHRSVKILNKAGEEIKVRKRVSNMIMPLHSQLSKIVESTPDKEK